MSFINSNRKWSTAGHTAQVFPFKFIVYLEVSRTKSRQDMWAPLSALLFNCLKFFTPNCFVLNFIAAHTLFVTFPSFSGWNNFIIAETDIKKRLKYAVGLYLEIFCT